MSKYSRADLLKKELFSLQSNDFLGKMLHKMNKTSSILLMIEVPLNFYLRAEVFCEDIQDMAEMPFSQNKLVSILYEDFLRYAKRNPDPHSIFGLLASLERQAGKDPQLEQQNKTVFKLVHKEVEQDFHTVNIRMRRNYALRGEVILADMEEVQPGHGYTLERVLELLYMDFIDKFRKGHNSADIINSILKLLEEE